MSVTPGATDWFQWHTPYDDPTSLLAQRLRAIQRLIAVTLDRCPPGPVRAISICAGQARDLLGVLPHHPRRGDVRARLVELDPRNAEVARSKARAEGLHGVHVVTADGSLTTSYEGMVPADLVLLCGVFGHASAEDIHHIVRRLPELCAAGGTVVWTRGGFHPGLRPVIRRWFAEEAFEEMAFETAGEKGWGVGAHRFAGVPRPFERGVKLFTFLDHAPGLPA